MLQNLPQLVIQIIYSVVIQNVERATALAFIASALSIIASVIIYRSQKQQRKELVFTKYFIRFGHLHRQGLSPEQIEKIENNKGLKGKLQRSLASCLCVSNTSIEVGYVTSVTFGCIIHIQHAIFKGELNNLTQQIFSENVSDMSDDLSLGLNFIYIKRLYECQQSNVDSVLREHFGMSDDKFMTVKYYKKYEEAMDRKGVTNDGSNLSLLQMRILKCDTQSPSSKTIELSV